MRLLTIGLVVALLGEWGVFHVPHCNAAASAEPSASAVRSYPPDKTNYRRKAIPEDVRPGGKPAVGPNAVVKPQPTPAANR